MLKKASGNGPPSNNQIFTTLRLCLRYCEDNANVFTRLMKALETVNFISILAIMPQPELRRLLPMLGNRLGRIQLEMAEVQQLFNLCKRVDVDELPQIKSCVILSSKWKPSSEQLKLLGQLLPGLKQLIVHGTSLDIKNIWKCPQLREVQLPLMLQSPRALCNLSNLRQLTLSRLQLWPGLDWMPVVKEIIWIKRYELQRINFDGSWLAAPLDLSLLQLQCCWALRELVLSNCKLADHGAGALLPLGCRRFTLRHCTLNRLLGYLKESARLQLLEILDCQLLANSGQLLLYLLKQRQCLPATDPLKLRFSLSTPLRQELTSWPQKCRQYRAEWLDVREVHETEKSWQQPLGTVTMIFGNSIKFTPDLKKLNELPDPTPADLVKDME